ncbi:MAG: HD domain-containing protein [Butyrivibrio sp.]|nr:HD domain-containing phosphohydrolase [Butyrivibrio sp.]MBR1643113.1 HD domain-containing protein [Butyrivibrio sp.]
MLLFWPKLFAALYFALLNTWIKVNNLKKGSSVKDFLALFLVSSAFLSIPEAIIAENLFLKVITLFNNGYGSYGMHAVWSMTADFLAVFLGMILYKLVSKQDFFQAGVVYLEFACIERICMVISISPVTYFIVYVMIQLVIILVMRKEVDFIENIETVQYRRMLFHLVGLLFIVNSMYSAYYIFPELNNNVINAPSVMWIDATTLIASTFTLGYYKLSIREAKLNESKMKWMKRFQEGQENIIQTFAELSEAKSGETGQHVRRVAEYCKFLAEHLGADEKEADCIRIAAMMHDVGKLLIPQEIIEKPGKLTEEEYDIVKQHTIYGDQLLSKSDGHIMKMARAIAFEHHEHWDGSGYPRGLSGSQISFYAQIAAVADVYDALSSKRSYKPAWAPEDAKEYILSKKGSQFAPDVVDAFDKIYNDIEAVRAKFKDE